MKPEPSNPVPQAPAPDLSEILAGGGRRRGRAALAWLVVAVLVVAAAAAALKWRERRQAQPLRFVTQPAATGSLTVTVTATGTLQPINQVDVGSELSGIVRGVEVDYNDAVARGQVLARLDTTKLEAQVLQSEAALASAKAKVLQARAAIQEARTKSERLKKLSTISERAVSPLDLDVAEAALARARADEASALAETDRARAVVEVSRTDLGKAVIRSPIDGIVLERAVEPGQTVAASLQAPVLFTLAEDLTQMELHVDVDEADVGQVRAGQDATFSVDAFADRTFPARITQVRYGSKTTGGVVTYETLLSVDNSGMLLRPGMTATAEIVVDRIENALLVPNGALRFTPPESAGNGPPGRRGILTRLFPRPPRGPEKQRETTGGGKPRHRVWALQDGRPVPLPVTIGMTDGTRTQIVGGGVAPGMALVVDIVGNGK